MEHPLTKYRARKNLTQAELGAELGVTHATVCRWENGTRTPRVRELIRISEITGIAAADLLQSTAATR